LTTIPTAGVTFVQAAELLAAHLAGHQLPEPSSLTVAQVHSATVASVAAQLLAWADTLTTVTAQAWRPPDGDRVHLSIASTLTGPADTVELDVYGGADADPALFSDLAPGEHRTVPLGHLRTWAASASDVLDGGAAA
jgi:hypothetical protein